MGIKIIYWDSNSSSKHDEIVILFCQLLSKNNSLAEEFYRLLSPFVNKKESHR
jgi:hypothetical protein